MRAVRLAALAGVAGVAAVASAVPTAIIQTSGIGANAFADSGMTIQFESIDRPNKSGTGAYWVLLARNTGSTAVDAMVITGTGTTYATAAVEGGSVTLPESTEVEPGRYFSTSDRYMDINASGEWVAIGNLTNGASDDDEVVYEGTFGAFTGLPIREGDMLAGFTCGSANYAPTLTDSGAIASVWDMADQPSDTDIVYVIDGVAVLQEGVSVPAGQLGGTSELLASPFGGRNAFQTNSSGSSYLAQAELAGGDFVVIIDGTVALQEGQPILGGTDTLAGVQGEINLFEDSGDWYIRGVSATNIGLAFKNGAVVAAEGDLVGASVAGEHWDSSAPDSWATTDANDTTFTRVMGNNTGAYVLAGFTDNPDRARDFAWVEVTPTGSTVERLRAGDQIDLNGDGTLDDAFVAVLGRTSASVSPLGGFFADDGGLYVNVDVVNAAGTEIASAFLYVPPVAQMCSPADLAAPFGTLNFADVQAFLGAFGSSDPSADLAAPMGTFNFADVQAFLGAFGMGCPGA